jgi:phage tail-like protein
MKMKTPQIRRLLPPVYQVASDQRTPLDALLESMEKMHGPAEAVLDQLEIYFDPLRSPEAFVPYLASWVDLEPVLDMPRSRDSTRVPTLATGIGRLRALTATAVTLSRWRGTRKGLLLFLQAALGMNNFMIEEETFGKDGKPIAFHIRITAPAESLPYRSLVQRIIELEKPAYVTYDLTFASPVELLPVNT